jgi:hypothetical protein
MAKNLNFQSPPSLAIAADAISPNPGAVGVQIWSTVAAAMLTWNGTSWTAPAAGGGGGDLSIVAIGGF